MNIVKRLKKGGKMQLEHLNGASHQWLLHASLRAEQGSVKGACGMNLCAGEGIYLPLTGSDQALSWRLRPLMEYKNVINNFH